MPKSEILIVDDSPTMRLLLIQAMKRVGTIRCTEAVDGMDALRRLSQDQFDLALIDINMPVMDGITLIRLIREDSRIGHFPIVVVTTEGGEKEREHALAIGADAYITKPIQANQVREMVINLLKAQSPK